MSIDFSCSSCRRTIRVPDGTEGKKTKCPQCQQVQVIPDKNALGTPPASTPPPSQPSPPPTNQDSLFDDLEPTKDSGSSSPAANPFGDAPDPFGAPQQNPYSSPSSAAVYGRPTVSRDAARSKLMGPAIGILITTTLGLLAIIAWLIATIVEIQNQGEINDPAEMFGATIALLLMFGLPILLSLLCIGAMIRAFAVRNYALVMTGFILSLTPFAGCFGCILGLPLGIWGIIVMADDSVKAAFRQP